MYNEEALPLVHIRRSFIEGFGAFPSQAVAKGDTLVPMILPSIEVDKHFKYDCNVYVMHRDMQGAAVIDPGDCFRGNFAACL